MIVPNWKPLEMRLGAPRCAGFMFMGRLNGVNQYKHGVSRRYLFLDDDGRAYEAAGRDCFREIPFEEALARVVERSIGWGKHSKQRTMKLRSGGKRLP